MQLPMTMTKLSEMWAEDCKLNIQNIAGEISRIPELHSKYLRIHSHHNLIVKKLSIEYNTLKKTKHEYLSGDLNNPEDLKELNLPPMTKRILKPEMGLYIEADKDLNNILARRAINQEIVDVCAAIIKEISNRTYQIGNIIKWKQFENGAI